MAAKKKRKTRAKAKAATPRQAAALTVDLGPNLVPGEGTTCGCYIRSLVMIGKPTTDILDLVKKHFPDSTATGSDVSWNRGKLKQAGKKLPEVTS